jgi:L-rhamnose isomerase/sugar isomerase
MNDKAVEVIWKALDRLVIELPSWGFANTGTRFGKFIQPAAATSIQEKFSDAAQVHAVTGACPTLALHVQWDLPNGLKDVPEVERLAEQFSIRPGSINPNIFQNQEYKYGSVGNPDPAIRRMAIRHILDCVAISEALGAPDISPWFADGSNYPGTQNIRKRIGYFEEGLREIHAALKPGQRLLLEYKPFEPAFYHTDIADWGMALLLARAAGPQALVLVDTGHHYQAQNIEQIVAWLLHQDMMGGFHFNDRRYADDDLTLGSIDRHRVHGRSKPQSQGQDRSNDSDCLYRSRTLLPCSPCGSRQPRTSTAGLFTRRRRGNPSRSILAGRPTGYPGVEKIAPFACRSDASIPD